MENSIRIISTHKVRLIIWIFIILLPFLMLWQGGDITDTGYNVSVYHFFFDRLSSGTTETLFFLSSLTGAIWYYFLPFSGVAGIKILGYLFLMAIVFLTSGFLNAQFPKRKTLNALLLLTSVVFCLRSFPLIFNYDVFTTFWFALLLWLLRKPGQWNFMKLARAGFIIALLGLSRFPNFIFILLFCGFLMFCQRKYPEILARGMNPVKSVLTGFFAGLFIFILGLFISGADFAFFKDMQALNLLNQDSSSYNFTHLLMIYAKDFGIFLVFLFVIFILYSFRKLLPGASSDSFLAVTTIFVVFLMISSYPVVLNYNHSIKYTVPATALVLLSHGRMSKHEKIFSWLLLMMAMTQTFGSNTGIFLKMNVITILFLPFAVLVFMRHTASETFFVKGFILYIMTVSLLLISSGYYGVGYELFGRKSYTKTIEVSAYEGIHTTQKQKTRIENFHQLIKRNATGKNQMFIFGHAPMMYYLNSLEPATDDYWLMGHRSERINEITAEVPLSDHVLILEDQGIKLPEDSRNFFHLQLKNAGYYRSDSLGELYIWKTQTNEEN